MPRNEACARKRIEGSATARHAPTGAYPASSPDGESPQPVFLGLTRYRPSSTSVIVFTIRATGVPSSWLATLGIASSEPLDPGSRVDVEASGDALEAGSGTDMASIGIW